MEINSAGIIISKNAFNFVLKSWNFEPTSLNNFAKARLNVSFINSEGWIEKLLK